MCLDLPPARVDSRERGNDGPGTADSPSLSLGDGEGPGVEDHGVRKHRPSASGPVYVPMTGPIWLS